jgi:hypothetical protein
VHWDADAFVTSHAPQVNPTGQDAGLTPAAAAGSSQEQQGQALINGRQLTADSAFGQQVGSDRGRGNGQSSHGGSHGASCTYGPFAAKAYLSQGNRVRVTGLSPTDMMEDYTAGSRAYDVVLQQQVGAQQLQSRASPKSQS